MSITQDEATRILTAALAKAKETNIKVSVLAARIVEQIASSATGDSAMPAQLTVNGTVTGRSPGAQP